MRFEKEISLTLEKLIRRRTLGSVVQKALKLTTVAIFFFYYYLYFKQKQYIYTYKEAEKIRRKIRKRKIVKERQDFVAGKKVGIFICNKIFQIKKQKQQKG